MDGWTRATAVVAAAGGSAAVVTFFAGRGAVRWARRRHPRSPEEAERLRRGELNGRGRIAFAEIVDVIDGDPAQLSSRVVVYRYEVAGVEYEAAQEVSGFVPAELLTQALAGGAASVKYDPRRPVNSIIACEEWSGLTESAFPDGRKACR